MGKDHILFGYLHCNVNECQSLVCISRGRRNHRLEACCPGPSREGMDTGDTGVASLPRMGSEEGGHVVRVLGEMWNSTEQGTESEANSLRRRRRRRLQWRGVNGMWRWHRRSDALTRVNHIGDSKGGDGCSGFSLRTISTSNKFVLLGWDLIQCYGITEQPKQTRSDGIH